jgi:hypothetical protein
VSRAASGLFGVMQIVELIMDWISKRLRRPLTARKNLLSPLSLATRAFSREQNQSSHHASPVRSVSLDMIATNAHRSRNAPLRAAPRPGQLTALVLAAKS